MSSYQGSAGESFPLLHNDRGKGQGNSPRLSSSLAGAKMRSMSAFSRMHPFRDEEQGLLYQSDGEIMPISNLEDFLTEQNPKAMKTGRQRKKQAARTKGGEFQAKPKKRRVYFACISKEIDIQKLTDFFEEKAESSKGPEVPWQCTSYGDVLRLFKPAPDILLPPSIPIPYVPERLSIPALKPFQRQFSLESANGDAANDTHPGSPLPLFESQEGRGYDTESKGLRKEEWDGPTIDAYNARAVNLPTVEIFVFDFGVAVFWGVAKTEEKKMLDVFRGFAGVGLVDSREFKYGEDDMAFVTTPYETAVAISNDVINIPEEATAKQRLAVSFAIAQSTLLAIFEARIDHKVEQYKYIPEKMAESGKVFFSQTQLGRMIGEVFVIRHDVNLHTEILDTPDFFWSEKLYEPDYLLVSKYLEMQERTAVLNKRLDMLRELLEMIQQQMENDHAAKLEWIVIWLILIEVALEVISMTARAIIEYVYQ